SSTNVSSSSGRSRLWSIVFAIWRSVRFSIVNVMRASLDVGPEDVAREQEASLHEVVGLLEVAVLVLDDHVAVVAGPPQRPEQVGPLHVPEARQPRHLPADPHREDAVLVEPFAIDPQVLRLDVEDVRPELPDEPRDVDHLEDQVARVEVQPDRAAPL